MNISKIQMMLAQAMALEAIAPQRETSKSGERLYPKAILSGMRETIEELLTHMPQLPESDGEMLERMGTDAVLWAEEFAKRNPKVSGKMVDNLFGWFANAIEAGRTAGQRAGQPDTVAAEKAPDTGEAGELKRDKAGATEGCDCFVCQIKRRLYDAKNGTTETEENRMGKDFREMLEGLIDQNITGGVITLAGSDAETFFKTGKLPDNILKEMQAGSAPKTTKH